MEYSIESIKEQVKTGVYIDTPETLLAILLEYHNGAMEALDISFKSYRDMCNLIRDILTSGNPPVSTSTESDEG